MLHPTPQLLPRQVQAGVLRMNRAQQVSTLPVGMYFHPYGKIVEQENLLHAPAQDVDPQLVGYGGHSQGIKMHLQELFGLRGGQEAFPLELLLPNPGATS